LVLSLAPQPVIDVQGRHFRVRCDLREEKDLHPVDVVFLKSRPPKRITLVEGNLQHVTGWGRSAQVVLPGPE
jgi:hypothetical protein